MASRPPIALLTDFGQRDPSAGIMKGVILGINPSATIVDVCHEIDPGNIRSASFALHMAFPYFPAGTIFVVVVDPGVGTERRAIAASIDGRLVVCPDNGILSWVVRSRPLTRGVELNRPQYFLPEVSETFHGRDIFAPAAAHLSVGVRLEEMGTLVNSVTTFPVPEVAVADRSLQGEVVYIDRFGNLLTNIGRAQFESWRKRLPDGRIIINIGSLEIGGISRTYGAAQPGHAVAVFGSAGILEVAVNGGSAAQSFGTTIGTHVLVYHLPG